MILHESVEPLSFYPAVLTQLSTFGVIHNHTPLAKTKVVPALADEPERRIPIFRFYFDGLIAHVHNQASDEGYTESLDSLIAGQSERLTISTVTYERSFQHENINLLKADMERL